MPSKRKSKFGISSLIGRRKSQAFDGAVRTNGASDFAPSIYSEDSTAFAASRPSDVRKSMNSRKLEELVQQEPDFVAYRYPSNTENQTVR
jgi:hypothetical protein